MEKSLVLANERKLTESVGKNLGKALDGLKKVDKEIAITLGRYTNPIRPKILNKLVPKSIKRRLITNLMGLDPLGGLEKELRKSINETLVETGKINKEVQNEIKRIEKLEEYRETAREENWKPSEYLRLIEDNTGLELKIEIDGEEHDFKEVTDQMYEATNPEKQKEKQKEWYKWFDLHINRSKDYLETMQAIGRIALDKIGPQTMAYFDITQLRPKQQRARILLETLQEGAVTSTLSEEAMDAYGKELVNAAIEVYNTYERVKQLRESNKSGFKKEVDNLRAKIDRMPQLEAPIEKRKGYLLPGRTTSTGPKTKEE